MDLVKLQHLQERQLAWRKRMFPGVPLPIEGGLGTIEELGELAHAELKMLQGIRYGVEPRYEGVDFNELAKDAVADAIIYAMSLANCVGLDLAQGMSGRDGITPARADPMRCLSEAFMKANMAFDHLLHPVTHPAYLLSQLALMIRWLELYCKSKNWDIELMLESTMTDIEKRERKQ